MKGPITLRHEFVEYVPTTIEKGTLYVSITYATAAHKCVCGCGNDVITPITPTDWQLTYDGESITLYPSIGNWNFPCKSHYFIRENKVQWAPHWTKQQIDAGRARDQRAKEQHFDKPPSMDKPRDNRPSGAWRKFTDRFRK